MPGQPGAPFPPGPPGPPAPYGATRQRPPWLVPSGVALGSAALVIVLVLVMLPLFRSDPSLTVDGKSIDKPEETLEAAEGHLDKIVDDRHGASDDSTRCYFSLPNEDTSDVAERLRCGPVLFVDSDVKSFYLSFPLERQPAGDKTRLVPVEEPEEADPTELDKGEILRRPDGEEAPAEAGFKPPEPPPAEEGVMQATDLSDAGLEEAGADAKIGSLSTSLTLSAYGETDRFGQGDNARRAADGEKLVGAILESGLGENPLGTSSPEVKLQVDDEDPVEIPEDVAGTIGEVGFVVGVPEDAQKVDLVVTEGDVTQSLSLLTGEPGEDNVAVLRRENREQTLDVSADLPYTLSKPGFVSENHTVKATIKTVHLSWYNIGSGDDAAHHPAPGRAWLVSEKEFSWDGAAPSDESPDPPAFTLTLPDGTVLEAQNLATDPARIFIAFDVPADFTKGTMTIGGSFVTHDGINMDFGASALQAPIEIPEG